MKYIALRSQNALSMIMSIEMVQMGIKQGLTDNAMTTGSSHTRPTKALGVSLRILYEYLVIIEGSKLSEWFNIK